MAVKVISLADRKPQQRSWSNEELAELYRVEHALVQAGIALETDCGLTDEGDPWFAFCRRQGEVLVHIARYDGLYRLYSPAFPEPLTGLSFSALTKSFVSGLRAPVRQSAGVSIHPAALLSVLVAAVFYAFDLHSNPAHAAKAAPDTEHGAQSSHVLPDVPAGDALNDTLVGSLAAFCNRSSEAVSSVLAKVEAAATVIAAAVAVLADSGHWDLANDSGSGHAAADHQTGLADHLAAADLTSASEQHHAGAGEAAPSQAAAFSDDPPGAIAADGTQALPMLAAAAADQGALGSDKVPGLGSSQAQFGYNSDAASAQLDGGAGAFADETIAALAAAAGLHGNSPADGLPAAIAGQLGDDPDGGQHSVNLLLADGDAAVVSGVPSATTVNINLAGGGGSIDLSGAGSVDAITVAGDGSLLITGIALGATPEIIVAPNYDVSLSFGAGSAGASPVIKLLGQDQLLLADAPGMPLTLDSEGGGANKVSIADTAVPGSAALDLTVAGSQALQLEESAAAYDNTQFDTSAFSGNLTIGLDLQNSPSSVDLAKVTAADFIVGDGNVVVLQAVSGTDIGLGSGLSNVEVSVEAAAAAPTSLSFDLGSGSGQPAPESINLLEPMLAQDVAINSTGGAWTTGVNTVATLLDESLSVLTLTGDAPLTIGAIEGPTAGDPQDITIDAHALTGALNLNVSEIADSAAGGRSITIIGGSGWNVLTNLTATESTTFIPGPGENTIDIGAGSVSDTVYGLTGNTGVNVGSVGYTDIIVDELNAGTNQALIDGQTSLIAAAQAASGLAGSGVAHQALLFSYQGVEYAFIDAAGSHVFDPAQDAIIKLIGVPPKADLAGVFHSA